MAAVGSAVGLGNVWRFPYVAYESGGGAFLIPYFIALVTAGIPMLILEMGLGQRMQAAAPLAFGKVHKGLEWFGWWAAGLSAVIVIYYSTIMAWTWVYLWRAPTMGWGDDAEAHFVQQVLQRSEGPGEVGAPLWYLIIGMALTWALIYLILRKGVRSVGKVVLITVPLPLVLLVVMAIRGLTLPGAVDGIAYYLTPDFSKLLEPRIWLRAYGQIFFSLSLASGVMIAYGSFLGKKAEVTNSALITAFANCGTSFFAGFAVFSMLGYLARVQGLSVPEVTTSGTGLAFVAYPTAIAQLPALGGLFGVIFFITLLALGIDSAFALQEAFTTGFHDKWGIGADKLAAGFIAVAFPISLIFTTRGGFYWFDIVDKWVCDFGLVTVGLVQAVVIGWLYDIHGFRQHLNQISEVRLGAWWVWMLRVVTPVVLAVMLVMNVYSELTDPYEGYPSWATFVGGWLMLVAVAGVAFALWRRSPAQEVE